MFNIDFIRNVVECHNVFTPRFLVLLMNRRDEPELNLDQILDRLRSIFGKGGGVGKFPIYIIVIIVVGLLGFWLSTGIYRVDARERGVVRMFGSFSDIASPGLNFRLPSPITSLVKVDVEQLRTAEIGFRSTELGAATRNLDEALMLTTDNSIVEAQMVVQYRVVDPKNFVFNTKDPEGLLHTSAEVALRSIMGRTSLIQALTMRAIVEAGTREFLEELLVIYEPGFQITEIKLQVVDPPDEVKDAFQEVTRALEDETRLQNEALAYQADQLPRAKGQVQVSIRQAAAFHREQVEQATGEANRFLSLLAEYRRAPAVTRERLYIEALESILVGVDKTLIDSKVEVLPILDIAGLGGIAKNEINRE